MEGDLESTEKQEAQVAVQHELNRGTQQWDRDTHNHRRTLRDDPTACSSYKSSTPDVHRCAMTIKAQRHKPFTICQVRPNEELSLGHSEANLDKEKLQPLRHSFQLY